MGLSRSKVKWVFWQQFGLLDVHPVLKHVILSVQECTVLISISRTKLARFSSSSRSIISWIQELQTIIKPSRSLHTPPGSGVGHISYSTRLSQQPLEKEKKTSVIPWTFSLAAPNPVPELRKNGRRLQRIIVPEGNCWHANRRETHLIVSQRQCVNQKRNTKKTKLKMPKRLRAEGNNILKLWE